MALKFKGTKYLRQVIACSLLSGRAVVFEEIRANHPSRPGLRDYEFSLLQLVDKLTNGSRIDVNEVGTRVRFYPGMIHGGLLMDHECGTSRGVGYYIEFLCTVAPFGKKPMEVLLSGCTNVEGDLSIDALREMTIRMMTYFGIDKNGLAIDVISRGFAPEGGGKVRFSCPVVRQLNSVDRLSSGKIRRIRGTAVGARTSPSMVHRVAMAAKEKLVALMEDTYIHADFCKGDKGGRSPGFGVLLIAEGSKGDRLMAEAYARVGEKESPEDVGQRAVRRLLSEIEGEGVVDRPSSWIVLLWMVLTPEDISRIRFSKDLSPYAIQIMRNIKKFFGIRFDIVDDHDKPKTCIISCRGTGYHNISKKVI